MRTDIANGGGVGEADSNESNKRQRLPQYGGAGGIVDGSTSSASLSQRKTLQSLVQVRSSPLHFFAAKTAAIYFAVDLYHFAEDSCPQPNQDPQPNISLPVKHCPPPAFIRLILLCTCAPQELKTSREAAATRPDIRLGSIGGAALGSVGATPADAQAAAGVGFDAC